jgi:hypothetical protein
MCGPLVQALGMSEDIKPPVARGASRRVLLGAATLGVAGSVIGLSAAPAAAHSTVLHNEINNQLIYYVGSGYPGSNTAQGFNATFYTRLETWLQFYWANTPGNWGNPMRVNHLGVHSDADSTSMHFYGRAIDLSTIQFTDSNTGGLFTAFDCRWNLWNPGSSTTLKRYWAGVAGLNYHVNYVLHYLYNAEHHNHVHADNQVSGGGSPTFSTGSRTQVLATQATLKYIWGYSLIGVDGIWGPQTNGYANKALVRIGRSGTLTSSGNWLEFNRASLRFGTGTQNY